MTIERLLVEEEGERSWLRREVGGEDGEEADARDYICAAVVVCVRDWTFGTEQTKEKSS